MFLIHSLLALTEADLNIRLLKTMKAQKEFSYGLNCGTVLKEKLNCHHLQNIQTENMDKKGVPFLPFTEIFSFLILLVDYCIHIFGYNENETTDHQLAMNKLASHLFAFLFISAKF